MGPDVLLGAVGAAGTTARVPGQQAPGAGEVLGSAAPLPQVLGMVLAVSPGRGFNNCVLVA